MLSTALGSILPITHDERWSTQRLNFMKIAIVDSNSEQVATIADVLDELGHDCYSFTSSEQMLRRFALNPFQMIVVNLQNPQEKARPVKAIRQIVPATVPVLCLTSSTNEYALTTCLDDGANDYVITTIRRRELAARVMVLLHKAYPVQTAESQVKFGSHVFEQTRGHLMIDGALVDLTRKEFNLALLFFRNAGRPLSRALIMETVWKDESIEESRTMDTHISRVRNKIGLVPENGFRLSPVYGYGYRLDRVNSSGDIEDDRKKRTRVAGAPPSRISTRSENRLHMNSAVTSI